MCAGQGGRPKALRPIISPLQGRAAVEVWRLDAYHHKHIIDFTSCHLGAVAAERAAGEVPANDACEKFMATIRSMADQVAPPPPPGQADADDRADAPSAAQDSSMTQGAVREAKNASSSCTTGISSGAADPVTLVPRMQSERNRTP